MKYNFEKKYNAWSLEHWHLKKMTGKIKAALLTFSSRTSISSSITFFDVSFLKEPSGLFHFFEDSFKSKQSLLNLYSSFIHKKTMVLIVIYNPNWRIWYLIHATNSSSKICLVMMHEFQRSFWISDREGDWWLGASNLNHSCSVSSKINFVTYLIWEE